MGSEKGLESLQVWQKAMSFAVKVQKELLPLFPPEEKWALASQLRRAIQSIPANIAEGYGRYYYQDGIRFCYISRRSLEEVQTFLTLDHKLGYLPEKIFQSSINDLIELRKVLNGYITYLKKSKRGENEPGFSYVVREGLVYHEYEESKNDEIR